MKQQDLHYTAIGDSLTAGFGVSSEHSFPARYRAMAEAALGRKVKLHNTGKNGATSSEIVQSMKSDSEIRGFIQQADLITVTAGGNDLIQAAKEYYNNGNTQVLKAALVQYSQQMRALIRELKKLKSQRNRPVVIRMIGIYNPLPEFSEAAFWIKRFNAALYRLERDPIRAVDVYDAFERREGYLISDDHFHPNADGYLLIAELTHRLGYGWL